MKNVLIHVGLTVFILTQVMSCGDSKRSHPGPGANGSTSTSDSTQTPSSETEPVEETAPVFVDDGSTIEGLYLAKFMTINVSVNGTLPGSLTFYRNNETLYSYVRLFAGRPKVIHPQNVYVGSRCPNLADDKNADGFIDVLEGAEVWGEIIIPLDNNVNSQMAGANSWPVADLGGSYYYERLASFEKFFQDIKAKDLNETDNVVKSDPSEKFSFEGRVVVIQGVADTVILPDTVATTGRRSNRQTLPIACGVIKKVTTPPGTPYDGSIPGPVALPTDEEEENVEDDVSWDW